MIRKVAILLMILLIIPLLSGCWDYRGLNELTIVTGVAIDKDVLSSMYSLTFEFVDLSKSNKITGIKSNFVESKGATVFDAIRNAKKKLYNKLYFADAQVIVISHQIAKSEGIQGIIDFFLRDQEPRETINVIISEESTAKELIMAKGLDNAVTSETISKIIHDDSTVTASTNKIELYHVVNILLGQGKCLTLPAFHITKDIEELNAEANGIAAFHKDKLIGFLTTEETKYYMFGLDQIQGGLFTFTHFGNSETKITLEINKNKTQFQFFDQNGKLRIRIKPQVETSLKETDGTMELLDKTVIKELEKEASRELSNRIQSIIDKAQHEYHCDIFGFGNRIYQNDFKLWRKIGTKWDEIFSSATIQVQSEVFIQDTGFIQ